MSRKKIFTIILVFAALQAFLIEKILAKQEQKSTFENKQEINLEENRNTSTERRRTVVYAPPQLEGRSKKRIFKNKVMGTRRGGDSDVKEDRVTILAPNELAKTISSHPTFFVYLPRTKTRLMVLVENDERIIWKEYFEVEKAGIVELSFPPDKEGLKAGQDYRFVVSEVIDLQDRSRDLVAQIWINFSELSEIQKQELATLNDSEDRGIFLAKNSIWFDSLKAFKESRSFELLDEILAAVGLENIPVENRKG